MYKKTILMIEDDLDQQQLFRITLEKAGYSMVGKPDAISGLRWLDEVMPDLILLDVMLPQMSGVEMLEEIRKRPNGRDIPIIIITASSIQDADVTAYGVLEVLRKPILPQNLIASIERAFT